MPTERPEPAVPGVEQHRQDRGGEAAPGERHQGGRHRGGQLAEAGGWIGDSEAAVAGLVHGRTLARGPSGRDRAPVSPEPSTSGLGATIGGPRPILGGRFFAPMATPDCRSDCSKRHRNIRRRCHRRGRGRRAFEPDPRRLVVARSRSSACRKPTATCAAGTSGSLLQPLFRAEHGRVVTVRRSAHRVHRRVSHLAELSARTIVLAYVMTAVLWIALSDRVLGALISDPGALVTISALKGWAFVAVTGAILAFVLARHDAQRVRHAGEAQARESRLSLLAAHAQDVIYRYRFLPAPAFE